MKITIEVDRNILKGGEPDIAVYSFCEPVENIAELFDLYRRMAQAMGYSCGEIGEINEEDN